MQRFPPHPHQAEVIQHRSLDREVQSQDLASYCRNKYGVPPITPDAFPPSGQSLLFSPKYLKRRAHGENSQLLARSTNHTNSHPPFLMR